MMRNSFFFQKTCRPPLKLNWNVQSDACKGNEVGSLEMRTFVVDWRSASVDRDDATRASLKGHDASVAGGQSTSLITGRHVTEPFPHSLSNEQRPVWEVGASLFWPRPYCAVCSLKVSSFFFRTTTSMIIVDSWFFCFIFVNWNLKI